jgi:hypothetical protein
MAKALVEDHGVEVEVHTSWYVAPDEVAPQGVTEYCGGGLTVYRYRVSRRVICFWPKVSRECEVLHVLGFHRLLVPAALLPASHCVTVLQPYGNVSQVCGEPPSLGRSLRLLADKTVSKLMVSKFSIVLCLSEAERQAMVRAGVPAERARLLRSPVSVHGSAGGISDGGSTRDGNLFLCVCRVTRLKYIEHAITALPRAPRARLSVIGALVDEGYHRELVLRARDLGVEAKALAAPAERKLVAYRWPGNVRELVNVCRRLSVLAPGREISEEDLPAEIDAREPDAQADWQSALADWAVRQAASGEGGLLDLALPQFERILIQAALQRTQGHRQEAARLLGWGRNTLTRKLKELALEIPATDCESA